MKGTTDMTARKRTAPRRATNVVYISDYLTSKGQGARARLFAPPAARRQPARARRSTAKSWDAAWDVAPRDAVLDRIAFEALIDSAVAEYHSVPKPAPGEPLLVRQPRSLDDVFMPARGDTDTD